MRCLDEAGWTYCLSTARWSPAVTEPVHALRSGAAPGIRLRVRERHSIGDNKDRARRVGAFSHDNIHKRRE
jgi:hypothetical protein